MYAQAAQGATSFITGYIAANAANDVADIQAKTANIIRAGNNKVVEAENKRNAVLTGMQRWAQETRNKRVYESIENNQEALAVNFNRSRDQRTRSNFAQTIRNAEEQGRLAASAAASGVTGSVVDNIAMTATMRAGMEDIARQRAEGQMTYDFTKREGQQLVAGLDQLDYSPIFDNPRGLDYGVNVARTQNALVAGLTNNGALKDLVQGGSSFFNFNTPKQDSLDAFLTLNDNFSQSKV